MSGEPIPMIVVEMQNTLHQLRQRASDKAYKHSVAVELKKRRSDFIKDALDDARLAADEVKAAEKAIKALGYTPEDRGIATGLAAENLTVEQLERELFK